MICDPHGDDWIDATSAIIHHLKNGHRVIMLALSGCEESLPEGFTLDDYHKEWRNSLAQIKIVPKDIHMGPQWFSNMFPVRNFDSCRQNILQLLIEYRKLYNPSVVYCPSQYDLHQDHAVVCNEVKRAFSKTSTIYGYDMPWNNLDSHLQHYERMTENDVQSKIKAASCFKSQLCKANNSLTEEFIRSLAVVRGNRIGERYAEAFEVIVSRG